MPAGSLDRRHQEAGDEFSAILAFLTVEEFVRVLRLWCRQNLALIGRASE